MTDIKIPKHLDIKIWKAALYIENSESKEEASNRIDELLKEEFINKLQSIKNISDSLNVSMAQLSIAWCLANKNVSTVILGASKKSQLKENLRSLEVYQNLSPEDGSVEL